MTPVRLEPADPRSRVKHSTTALQQLRMKFQLRIRTRMLKNIDGSCLQILIAKNVKMSTIAGILTLMSMMNFMLS